MENKKLDIKERLQISDIYWNIKIFLDNYDENIEVLKQHQIDKRFNIQTKPISRDFGDDEKYNC